MVNCFLSPYEDGCILRGSSVALHFNGERSLDKMACIIGLKLMLVHGIIQ